jgi:hypothetical protein
MTSKGNSLWIMLPALLVLGAIQSARESPAEYADADLALFKLAPKAKHTPSEGVARVLAAPEVALSAGLRPGKPGDLVLFVHTASKGLETPAQDNTFKEYAGSAVADQWTPEATVVTEKEHLARLSLQLRLMAKSHSTLPELIAKVEKEQTGKVIHIRPDLVGDKPQFLVILLKSDKSVRLLNYDLLSGEEVKHR